MRTDLPQMFRGIAELVGPSERTDAAFFGALARLLGGLAGFDHVVTFGYRGDERPIDLFHTFDARDYVIYVSKYQDGPYLLDPFSRAAREPRPGFWRMRELAPDRFFSSEYFRSYYVETGLAEEVGFFVPVPGGAAVVLSLMRKERTGVFPTREVASLHAVEPLVSALVSAHFADLSRRFDEAEARRHGGRRAARAGSPGSVWREMNLTDREAGVIELVLQGHSSDSIARLLAIATGTVKVHRRNVYRKLGITSQTQLLSIYLDRVSRVR